MSATLYEDIGATMVEYNQSIDQALLAKTIQSYQSLDIKNLKNYQYLFYNYGSF